VYRADISIDDVWSGSGAAPSGAASLSWWLANQYNVDLDQDGDPHDTDDLDSGMLVKPTSAGVGSANPQVDNSNKILGIVAVAMVGVLCLVLVHKQLTVRRAAVQDAIAPANIHKNIQLVDDGAIEAASMGAAVQNALTGDEATNQATVPRPLSGNDVSDMWEDPAI
jgi:hypothetical protein